MTSSIQNVGQPGHGALMHEPDETAMAPVNATTNTHAQQLMDQTQRAQRNENGGDGNSQGAGETENAQGQAEGGRPLPPGTTAPGGTQPGSTSPPPTGAGHSQHGIGDGGFGNNGNANGIGNGNGFGNGNGVGNGNGLGGGSIGLGNGASTIGLGAQNGGLLGVVNNTVGGLLNPSGSGTLAGLVQNTMGFVSNPIGSTLYAVNETVAQQTRPGEPIVDSDPASSRAPVRDDSVGSTNGERTSPNPNDPNAAPRTSTNSSAPTSDTSTTNLAASPTRPNATSNANVQSNTPYAANAESASRDPTLLRATPAETPPTARTNAPNASQVATTNTAATTDAPANRADPFTATTNALAMASGATAAAQAAGELAAAGRTLATLTMVTAPLGHDIESLSEVGRTTLFRADAGNGRDSVQDLYGRNYVAYGGEGRNVARSDNDRAITAIGTTNIDAIGQDRVSNHGELSTHELVWKTVVPALVGVGALFSGVSAAGLAVAGSGGAATALLTASTAIFGFGAFRASMALRDRAATGQSTNPLADAGARRDWIAAGANSLGTLASLALMMM
jgi:hypothetical protein